MMDILRVIVILVWAKAFARTIPALIDLWKGKQRYGDPARLVVAGVALLMIGFAGRWLIVPDSAEVFAALYVLSIIMALYTDLAAKSYGRSPPNSK